MNPRDVIAVGDARFVVLARSGPIGAVVPVCSGYHRTLRGDVALDARCGVTIRVPVARSQAAATMELSGVTVGQVSLVELSAIMAGVSRARHAVELEQKYGADRQFTREAAREITAVR